MAHGAPDWTETVGVSAAVTSTVTAVPAPVTSRTFGEIVVTGTRTLICAANSERTGLTIYEPSATEQGLLGTSAATVFIGDVTVTVPGGAAPGDVLEATESVTYAETGAWYGITRGSSVTVSFEDE